MPSSKIYERFGVTTTTVNLASAATAIASTEIETEGQTEAVDFEDLEKALVIAHIPASAGTVTLTIEGGSTSVAGDHSTLTGVAGVASASASASVGSAATAQELKIEVHSSLLAENDARYMSASVTNAGADAVPISITVLTEENSLPSGESVDLEATVSTFS